MELATLRTLYFANLFRRRRIAEIVRAVDGETSGSAAAGSGLRPSDIRTAR